MSAHDSGKGAFVGDCECRIAKSLRLRDKFDALYLKEASGLLPDPWAARDAYVAVVLDRTEERVTKFLTEHAPSV